MFVFGKIDKVGCGLGDLKECDGTQSECSARKVPTLRNQRKHRTKQGDLWEFCGLSVAFVFQHFRLYKNAAKIFGIVVLLCRRFENLENKMVYTTREKCSVYYVSRVSVFF